MDLDTVRGPDGVSVENLRLKSEKKEIVKGLEKEQDFKFVL